MAFVYSCCFWFSLRLGGILIGLFSIIKTTIALVFLFIGYTHPHNVKNQISMWKRDINLIYMSGYIEHFEAVCKSNLKNFIPEPEKYICYCITICCIYIFLCFLYIYGAYTCNNALMVAFIMVELIHLIILSIFVTTWLIILKKNTMDIGLVIGASVASGFILMGLFYLWVCAATLPTLINEIEREEQLATINKLQELLENKNGLLNFKNQNTYYKDDNDDLLLEKKEFVCSTNT
ncbi:uncharacterized protein LOC123653819 [Melitaea cinxia]|uniref:uncharacterized protein LOC123653819 n=1 Tax=Melitaea cinxia TaxID=113334 RepID=UPI001E26FC82|nr:uncharacterized protein LOC123653819 [Melitaea cinxia]